VQGRVTPNQSRAGGYHVRIQAGSGHQVQPDYGVDRGSLPGAAAESILIERIPGKSTIGIEVPNDKRQTIALRDIIEAPEFLNSPSKLNAGDGARFAWAHTNHRLGGHATLADRRLEPAPGRAVHQLAADVDSV